MKSWPLTWSGPGRGRRRRRQGCSQAGERGVSSVGTRRLQGVVGPGATSVRTSSIRHLEKVGKVSVSGTLAWSELQKECAKGERDGG